MGRSVRPGKEEAQRDFSTPLRSARNDNMGGQYAGRASQRDSAGGFASRADAHYPGKTSALGAARRLAVEAGAEPLVHQRGARASVGCRADVFRARAPNGGRAVSAVAGV